MQINDFINKPGVKKLYQKFKIYNFDDNWEIKSVPAFFCRIERNKEVENKRTRKAEQYFPYHHQILKFELEKTNSLKLALEQLQFAIQDKQYMFPNGTVVFLLQDLGTN